MAQPTPEETRTISLPKRAYKVFTTVFHNPSKEGQPGEIPWTDFLHAMRAMGFAPEKLYGSVWQFTPANQSMNIGRSIQFHEPHPEKKIPYRQAKRIGRRLNRAFGWSGEMFVLRE
jgi:hypothetical protein